MNSKNNRYQKSMDTNKVNKTRDILDTAPAARQSNTIDERETKQTIRKQTPAHREDGIFVSFNFDQFPNYATGNSKVRRFQRKPKKIHENVKTTGYEFYESYTEYKTKERQKNNLTE